MSKKFNKSMDLVEARSMGGKQPRLHSFDGLLVSDEFSKYEKVLDDDGVDSVYKEFVLRSASEAMRVEEGSRNLRERDEEHDYDLYYEAKEEEEEEVDPEFEFVLKYLKPYEKSYLLTHHDNVIKFEEATSSDTEHDEERIRKQRSATKQNGGPSSTMPPSENKGTRESHYVSSRKMEENGRLSTKKKVTRSSSIHPTLASKGDSRSDNDFDQERRRMSSGTKQMHGSESDTEHDEERIRKQRSATKQNGGPSSTMPLSENKGTRESHYVSSSKMVEKGRLSTKKKVTRSSSIHPTLASKGDSRSDNDFDQERRRMSSGTKQKQGSESAQAKEKEKLTRRIRQNKPKSKESKEEDEIIQMDPDFCIFDKYHKHIGGHYVFDPPGHKRIVYEMRSEERNQVKEEPYDGSYSDVEIMDSTEFNKTNKTSKSNYKDTAEYRRKVISNLKKPFNKEEYTKLLRDIRLHKTKERHLELRGGRERPYGTQESGKSYLDHHPDLKRKVVQAEGDEPKRLNLLRGFFLWIKQPECFCPWLDEECLATYPSPIVDFF